MALKSDDKTTQGRYDRLLAGAKKSATADQASLAQLAKEAEEGIRRARLTSRSARPT